jgi:hypothetical protein
MMWSPGSLDVYVHDAVSVVGRPGEVKSKIRSELEKTWTFHDLSASDAVDPFIVSFDVFNDGEQMVEVNWEDSHAFEHGQVGSVPMPSRHGDSVLSVQSLPPYSFLGDPALGEQAEEGKHSGDVSEQESVILRDRIRAWV